MIGWGEQHRQIRGFVGKFVDKVLQIDGGTDEIQTSQIARSLLGPK